MIRCNYLLGLFHHCPAQPCDIRPRTPCKSCNLWPCLSLALSHTHSSLLLWTFCFLTLHLVTASHAVFLTLFSALCKVLSLLGTAAVIAWAKHWFEWFVVETQMGTLSDPPVMVFIQQWFEDLFYTDHIGWRLGEYLS